MKKQSLRFLSLMTVVLMSVSGYAAIDWSSISFIGNGSGDAKYTDKYKVGAEDEANTPGIVNIQFPGWAAKAGIYLTFPAAAGITCSHDCAIEGAGICLYVDQFTAQETQVTVTYSGGSKTFAVYYVDGTTGAPTDTEAPVMVSASLVSNTHNSAVIAVSATDNVEVVKYVVYNGETKLMECNESNGEITVTGLTPSTNYTLTVKAQDAAGNISEGINVTFQTASFEGIDWSSISFIGNGSGDAKYTDKYKVGAENEANMPSVVNIQFPGWAAKAGIYLTFPAAGITCSHDCAIEGAGICLYLDQFTAQETQVTVTYSGGSKTFSVYYVDGTTGAPTDTEAPVMVSASLVSNTHNSAVIAVSATDNVEVVKYVVYNGDTKLMECNESNGEITVTGLTPSTDYTLTVKAQDAAGNISEGINVTFQTASFEGIDWDSYSWIGNSLLDAQYTEKYKVGADESLGETLPSIANIQQPAWASKPGIYMWFPAAEITCSHECAIDGAGMCLYVDQFTSKETKVNVTYATGSCSFTVYYVDGTESTTDLTSVISETPKKIMKQGQLIIEYNGTSYNVLGTIIK